MNMKKSELVFLPAPYFSHLVATIEFAKLLIDRDSRISITILLMNTLLSSSNSDSDTKSLLESETRIKFIHLPKPDVSNSPESNPVAFIETHKHFVKQAVGNLGEVVGLVIDFFCSSMIDVANEVGLPSYVLLTCSASFLGLFLHLNVRNKQNKAKFEDSDPEFVTIPTFDNPIPTPVLPRPLFSEAGYDVFSKLAKRIGDAKGIMVNTFKELESHAVSSLLEGATETPPVYPVGPILNLKSNRAHHDIMNWLDDQPASSVVFLCFGSAGGFGAPQMEQIAIGLENSGLRFLWSIKKSVVGAQEKDSTARDNLLKQFLERTKERGMTCEWVPQPEVLAHKAIGGFVSHCGWNSILESLWFGVPIVTWPIFAEQQLNAFMLVKELGLAVEMKLDYRMGGDLVVADEIEKAITCVMEGDGEVRRRVEEMREKGRKAVMDGGSSFNYIGRLIVDMIGK